jgi:hypothetical protein
LSITTYCERSEHSEEASDTESQKESSGEDEEDDDSVQSDAEKDDPPTPASKSEPIVPAKAKPNSSKSKESLATDIPAVKNAIPIPKKFTVPKKNTLLAKKTPSRRGARSKIVNNSTPEKKRVYNPMSKSKVMRLYWRQCCVCSPQCATYATLSSICSLYFEQN